MAWAPAYSLREPPKYYYPKRGGLCRPTISAERCRPSPSLGTQFITASESEVSGA